MASVLILELHREVRSSLFVARCEGCGWTCHKPAHRTESAAVDCAHTHTSCAVDDFAHCVCGHTNVGHAAHLPRRCLRCSTCPGWRSAR